jgi:TP901 family phage tail tape measure protein
MARFVLTAELSLQAPRNVAQVVQQIQSQLNGVQVNVQVQGARQAHRDVEQLARSADRANDSFFRMGRTFTASVRRFSALAIATRAVSLFTNTLSSAIEEAISFQQEVVRLSQVTGTSISGLSKLTDEITDLATTLGVSSDKLLTVTTILAQAGLSAEDTRVALSALAKTELAPTFGNITETAEGAVAILAQFKLGAGALESQLGSLNAVAGKFAVESGDLVEAIRRTGGVFKASGGDLNELISLFTSVRATTRESAATIATGLRTVFTRIQRPKTIEYLKQFGVELTDLEGKFVGPFEAVRRLSEALAGLEEGDSTFIAVAEELGGFRQIGKVIPLLREFAISQQALKVAQEGAGSLAKDQATAQQALAVQITKVKEEFFALVRGFTETSTFRAMADVLLKLASAFIQLAESIKPILPVLTAFAGIRIAQGIGGLMGGILGRARGMSTGGKVLAFAKGGLVPGSGNGDTVPAMLSPGEFVIRKSSVNKLGAANLAAMNENRYATGGIIALNPYDKGTPNSAIKRSGSISVSDVAERAGIPTGKGYRERFTEAAAMSANKELSLLAKSGKLSVDAVGLSIGDENVASQTESQIKNNFAQLINNSSQALAAKFKTSPSKQITPQDLELFGINGVIGNAFEAMLTTLGAPFDSPPQDELQTAASKANNNSAFDYPTGIGPLAQGNLSALASIPTDAKRTVTGKEVNEIITKKYPNLLADAARQAMLSVKGKELSSLEPKEGGYRTEDLKAYGVRGVKDLESLGWTSPFRGKWNPPVTKNLGGIIQKFAVGGIAKAPLVDDIVNASGTIMPQPSSAIAALIKAGGGAIDIDRTIKRTIGDKAYGSARTAGQQTAALDKYFRDPASRLNDIKSAPLTAFGKELQSAIKSKQLQAGKLSIVSKSQRVPGVAEYFNQLFGIPLANMIFTQGASKQPAMDALRTKGPRSERVARFAKGGGVGTDTVPALLTPGEFVINRKSAQAIGYGSLNRMNKVGKYAKGGVVQRFASGSSGRGVKSVDAPFQDIVLPNFSKLEASLFKFVNILDKMSMGGLSKLTVGINSMVASLMGAETFQQKYKRDLIYLNSVLPSFSAVLDSNSKHNKRTLVKQMELAEAIANHVKAVHNSGASQRQVQKAAIHYANTLAKNSRDIIAAKSGATSPTVQPSATAAQTNTQAQNPFATMGGFMGSKAGLSSPNNTSPSPESTDVRDRSMQMATALAAAGTAIGYFQTEITESSSTAAIFTNNIVTTVQSLTLVTAALQAFGVNLTTANIASKLDKLFSSVPQVGQLFGKLGIDTETFASGLQKGALAATAVVAGLNILMSTLQESSRLEKERQMKVAQSSKLGSEDQKRAIDKAGKAGASEAGWNTRNTFATVGGVIGGTAGTLAGAAGLGVGAVAGGAGGAMLGAGLGGKLADWAGFTEEAATLAEAQTRIATIKLISDKEMAEASKGASKALKDFQDGTATASDVLKSTASAGQLLSTQREEVNKANESEKANADKSGNMGAWLTGGYIDNKEERQTKADENSKIRNEELKKSVDDYIEMNQAGTAALARSNAASSQSFDQFFNNLKASNEPLAAAYSSSEENLKRLKTEFANLSKEAERTRKAFEAMDLGFQGVNATASAMTVGLENYLASQEAGNIGLSQSLKTLEAGLSNAAQGIPTDVFQSALADASSALKAMGGDTKKFEENMTAINTAQKFYASATEDAKKNLMAEFQRGAAGTSDPGTRKEALSNAITSQLEGAGISEEVRNRIGEALDGAKIEDGDLTAILGGNFEVLDKVLKDLGDKTFGQVNKALEQYVKYQQQLVKLTQERIKIEGALRDAQKSVVDSQLEAAKISQEFGGAAVTPDRSRQAIIAKANIDGQGLGVGNLQTGSAEEIRNRQAKIRQELGAIQDTRTGAAAGNKEDLAKLQGQEGARLADDEERLKKLAQENYNTTKALIDQKREEIKLINAKNQLEKSSMDALISGDIMKFFESQAAVGAQAALATGDQQLISQFDTASLGAATKDLEAQREAGVQQKFGVNIGGAGGLVESGYAAVGGRAGVGMDTVKAAAQTTPEQLQAESEARDLASTLPANMEILADSTQKQLDAADIQFKAAEKQLEAAKGEVKQSAQGPQQLARGGMVYASKGTLVNFKPKGTDTVPAMLTPGEFVVNRQAVQRGNNMAILSAMNKGKSAPAAVGMSKGGQVKYMQNGGIAEGGGSSGVSINIDVKALQTFSASLVKFNDDLATNIQNLKDTKFQISLSPTNINVNLTGTSFLEQLTNTLKQELMSYVGKEISQYTVGSDGKLKKSGSTLGTGL